MEKGLKINPQRQRSFVNKEYSPTANRMDLKKVQENVDAAKNRVLNLKKQLKKQKQSVQKNKKKVQEIINKKIEVSNLNSYKKRDSSKELQQIEEKKRKNKLMKLEHEKSLQNIQKAIYLVKLDDAREIRSINEEHKRKMRQMSGELASNQSLIKRKRLEDSEKSKEKIKQYWREKLVSVYTNQALQAQKINHNKQQKLSQLKKLEQQECKLMEQMNRYESKQIQSKKQYIAALSLPIKEVAQALGHSQAKNPNQTHSLIDLKNKKTPMPQKNGKVNRSMQFNQYQYPDIKLPHTNLNHMKLKVVLKELKKDQKQFSDD